MTLTPDQLERFWAKVRVSGPGCWEWIAAKSFCGYGSVRIGGVLRRAPRVAYELRYGPIPSGLIVRHKCDNPPCVNPDHLELGTHTDNARDREARGRGRSHAGERSGRAKLTNAQVEQLIAWRSYAIGAGRPFSKGDVAGWFGISLSHSGALESGRGRV